MLLNHLQNFLGGLYRVEVPADVADFLVTDESGLRAAGLVPDSHAADEKLLVAETDDGLELALYLDAALLGRLDGNDPLRSLNRANLRDFLTVLEGVSHFNYLAWNAAADKRVTLMELEMQAEVDKYVAARLLMEQQASGPDASMIFPLLFDDPRFHDGLTAAQLARYRSASLFAACYCRDLQARYDAARVEPAMVDDLRTFYRLPQPDKISHIHGAAFA